MRTIIDVDDDLLDAAQAELGTTTKKDTVNEALRFVAERTARARAADGVLATFVTVDLELGYSARDPREHQGVFRARGHLVQLACIDEIATRARQVQALLAVKSQHRVAGVMDLLTAAAAEHYGASVLHYDADFDHIAAVTGQPVDWIAPRGSGP